MKYLLPISLVFCLMLSFTACDIINPNDAAEENEEPEVSIEDFWEDLEFPGDRVSKMIMDDGELFVLSWYYGIWKYDMNSNWEYIAPISLEELQSDDNYFSDLDVYGDTLFTSSRHSKVENIHIWRSDDRGETWKSLDFDENYYAYIHRFADEPSKILLLGRGRVLSENYGYDWTFQSEEGGRLNSIPAAHPPVMELNTGTGEVLNAGSDMYSYPYLYHFDMYGKNLATAGFDDFNFPVEQNHMDRLWMLNQHPQTNDVYVGFHHTLLKGSSNLDNWEIVTSLDDDIIDGFGFKAMEFHPDYPHTMYLEANIKASESSILAVTHDNWNTLHSIPIDTTNMDVSLIYSLKYLEQPKGLLVGTNNGLFLYTGDMIEP